MLKDWNLRSLPLRFVRSGHKQQLSLRQSMPWRKYAGCYPGVPRPDPPLLPSNLRSCECEWRPAPDGGPPAVGAPFWVHTGRDAPALRVRPPATSLFLAGPAKQTRRFPSPTGRATRAQDAGGECCSASSCVKSVFFVCFPAGHGGCEGQVRQVSVQRLDGRAARNKQVHRQGPCIGLLVSRRCCLDKRLKTIRSQWPSDIIYLGRLPSPRCQADHLQTGVCLGSDETLCHSPTRAVAIFATLKRAMSNEKSYQASSLE
jgi:hypothetical protein